MSLLSDQFTGFPDFVDFRQDQMMEVLEAINILKHIDSSDPNHIVSTIRELDLPRLQRTYQNKCNDMRRGHHNMNGSLLDTASRSFARFKSVLGASDYV